MQLEKPDPDRVMLTARDPKAERPSKTITVYNTTPEKLMEEIERLLAGRSERSSEPQPA